MPTGPSAPVLALRPLLPWLAAAVLAVAAGCGADREPAAPRPSLLLVTADTLRADHVGAYGHPLDTTPNLDALAARGVRFSDASVQWPKTWPSMASMLTGTYPAKTGVRLRPRVALPGRNRTLAEVLGEAGYATAAVVSNVNLGRTFAFDQGFDHFTESWLEEVQRLTGKTVFQNAPGRVKLYTNETIVTDQALALLDRVAGDRPFFLWAHYMDPHGPYLPGSAHRDLFPDAYPQERVPLRLIPPYQRQPDPRTRRISDDLGFYRAQYDREIRSFDDGLGRLLGELEARGLADDTLVVVTADHGESLNEHHYFLEHGELPYQTNAGVPLVLVEPERLPAGRVVDVPVGLIDLVPTILDLLGLEVPETVEGRSLRPLLEGGTEAPARPVFIESGTREPSQLSIRVDRWKLVHFRAPEDRLRHGTGEFALFDLREDPGETRDRIAQHPELADALERELARWQASQDGAALAQPGEALELDADTIEMLRALGYAEETAP